MQKLISKYGLAAHLALLAVTPLFLSPFCAEATIAVAMMWMSAVGALWRPPEEIYVENVILDSNYRQGTSPCSYAAWASTSALRMKNSSLCCCRSVAVIVRSYD